MCTLEILSVSPLLIDSVQVVLLRFRKLGKCYEVEDRSCWAWVKYSVCCVQTLGTVAIEGDVIGVPGWLSS